MYKCLTFIQCSAVAGETSADVYVQFHINFSSISSWTNWVILWTVNMYITRGSCLFAGFKTRAGHEMYVFDIKRDVEEMQLSLRTASSAMNHIDVKQ